MLLAGGRVTGNLFETHTKLSSYKFPESEITSQWDLEEHMVLPFTSFIQDCFFVFYFKLELLADDEEEDLALQYRLREVIVSSGET